MTDITVYPFVFFLTPLQTIVNQVRSQAMYPEKKEKKRKRREKSGLPFYQINGDHSLVPELLDETTLGQ